MLISLHYGNEDAIITPHTKASIKLMFHVSSILKYFLFLIQHEKWINLSRLKEPPKDSQFNLAKMEFTSQENLHINKDKWRPLFTHSQIGIIPLNKIKLQKEKLWDYLQKISFSRSIICRILESDRTNGGHHLQVRKWWLKEAKRSCSKMQHSVVAEKAPDQGPSSSR